MKVKAHMEPYFTLIYGCLIAIVVLITGETWGRDYITFENQRIALQLGDQELATARNA
jgi:hypothetical protein